MVNVEVDLDVAGLDARERSSRMTLLCEARTSNRLAVVQWPMRRIDCRWARILTVPSVSGSRSDVVVSELVVIWSGLLLRLIGG